MVNGPSATTATDTHNVPKTVYGQLADVAFWLRCCRLSTIFGEMPWSCLTHTHTKHDAVYNFDAATGQILRQSTFNPKCGVKKISLALAFWFCWPFFFFWYGIWRGERPATMTRAFIKFISESVFARALACGKATVVIKMFNQCLRSQPVPRVCLLAILCAASMTARASFFVAVSPPRRLLCHVLASFSPFRMCIHRFCCFDVVIFCHARRRNAQ